MINLIVELNTKEIRSVSGGEKEKCAGDNISQFLDNNNGSIIAGVVCGAIGLVVFLYITRNVNMHQ